LVRWPLFFRGPRRKGNPAGNPTIVNIPNPIVSVAGGTEVTITGTGLAGVTAVTVGGLPAIVVSKTDTTVVVQVPVSTKTGLADLTITNDKGSVTSKSAIIYALNPVIKITKTKTITGFKAGQKVLTTAQKTAVKALITANPTLTTLACAAKTTGVASNKTELAKAKTLATATCAYAKTLKKTLSVSSTASHTLPKSKASRSTLRNSCRVVLYRATLRGVQHHCLPVLPAQNPAYLIGLVTTSLICWVKQTHCLKPPLPYTKAH
jgi:hypothetical protein